MQRVIVLRGAPASGKTTIAKSYRNFETKVAWLKIDNFKVFFAEDSSPALNYVNGSAIVTLDYLLREGFSVVVDGIFQDISVVNKAVEVAQNHHIPIRIFELEVSLVALQQRDKVREGVPEGIRKPLGDDTIANIYSVIKEKHFPNAITLDTENHSVEECKIIIDNSFD